uniref:hypothetical protein n=1 Tax=Kitasatospora sp. NBC_01519 TaxID=2903576 RepID=UPI002F9136C9
MGPPGSTSSPTTVYTHVLLRLQRDTIVQCPCASAYRSAWRSSTRASWRARSTAFQGHPRRPAADSAKQAELPAAKAAIIVVLVGVVVTEVGGVLGKGGVQRRPGLRLEVHNGPHPAVRTGLEDDQEPGAAWEGRGGGGWLRPPLARTTATIMRARSVALTDIP